MLHHLCSYLLLPLWQMITLLIFEAEAKPQQPHANIVVCLYTSP